MKKERILWGVLFILGAICLLFSHTDFMHGLQINVWNLLWTIILLAILIKSIVRLNYFGIFFPLAFLCVIYKEPLGITQIAPFTLFGAAILLSIGCNMLFPKKKYHGCCNDKHFHSGEHVSFDEVIDMDTNEYIRQEVNFGSCVKYINSDNFKGGRFECSFGAMKLYFTNTIMQDSQATVTIENSFGGTEIYVPKNWIVINQIHSVFGGVEEKGVHQPDGTHTLYLTGECNFGGIEIVYI